MNNARLQHYVPQFLLRRFTNADGSLAVFDKSSDRSFTTGTRAVAAEAFFYDVKSDEDVLTLEPGLAEVEAQAARIIESIHQDASLQGLSDIDRAKVGSLHCHSGPSHAASTHEHLAHEQSHH